MPRFINFDTQPYFSPSFIYSFEMSIMAKNILKQFLI